MTFEEFQNKLIDDVAKKEKLSSKALKMPFPRNELIENHLERKEKIYEEYEKDKNYERLIQNLDELFGKTYLEMQADPNTPIGWFFLDLRMTKIKNERIYFDLLSEEK